MPLWSVSRNVEFNDLFQLLVWTFYHANRLCVLYSWMFNLDTADFLSLFTSWDVKVDPRSARMICGMYERCVKICIRASTTDLMFGLRKGIAKRYLEICPLMWVRVNSFGLKARVNFQWPARYRGRRIVEWWCEYFLIRFASEVVLAVCNVLQY